MRDFEMWADEVAHDFLQSANPNLWSGKGDKPDDFDTKIYSYDSPYFDGWYIDISFEQDEEEWCHFCELRDAMTDELMDCAHGYGVDSCQNIVDTILYLRPMYKTL